MSGQRLKTSNLKSWLSETLSSLRFSAPPSLRTCSSAVGVVSAGVSAMFKMEVLQCRNVDCPDSKNGLRFPDFLLLMQVRNRKKNRILKFSPIKKKIVEYEFNFSYFERPYFPHVRPISPVFQVSPLLTLATNRCWLLSDLT